MLNSPIRANQYTFKHQLYIIDKADTINQIMPLLLYPNYRHQLYHIAIFDTKNGNIRWSTKQDFRSKYYRNFFILEDSSSYQNRKNPIDGSTLWRTKIHHGEYILTFSGEEGIAFNPTPKLKKTRVNSFDLSTGKILWFKEYPHPYRWSMPVEIVNDIDSTERRLFFISSGLNAIDLRSGDDWRITMNTNKKNYVTHSNLIIQNGIIYLASKDKILGTNFKGDTIWSTDLPLNAGTSAIYFIDSTIYFVNKGAIAKLNTSATNRYIGLSNHRYFSPPYIAAFDAITGKQKYFQKIENKKNKPLSYFWITEDNLIAISKNRISKYSLSNGNLIAEKYFNSKEKILDYPIRAYVYFEDKDGKFYNFAQTENDKYCIYTKKKDVIEIDSNFNLIKTHKLPKEHFICHSIVNSLKFISSSTKTVILDSSSNTKVGEYKSIGYPQIVGNKSYFTNGNKLIEVDLSSYFGGNYKE